MEYSIILLRNSMSMKSFLSKVSLYLTLSIASFMSFAENDSSTSSSTLYFVSWDYNKLVSYAVNPLTGMLTRGSSVNTGSQPGDIFDAHGKYLYIANWAEPTVNMYLASLTNVEPLKPKSIPTGSWAWSITVDPSEKFAYVPSHNENTISQYAINKDTGDLTPLNPKKVSTKPGPSLLTFNPLGTSFAYVGDYFANKINVYHFDQTTGQIKDTGMSVTTGMHPRGAWFDRKNHAYVLNEDSNTVSMFKVLTTGALEPLDPPTITTGMHPLSFTTSQNGNFAYVIARESNKIHMFKIESSGVLTPLNPDSIGAGYGPRNMAKDQYGHMYVTNMYEKSISMYNLNESTGLLTYLCPPKTEVCNNQTNRTWLDETPFIITAINKP
jgi:6-phosphogluconolactonase (cycloisomerase 2 family)